MIAKHVPMRSLGKSDFAGLANYITDAQSKERPARRGPADELPRRHGRRCHHGSAGNTAQNTRATGDKTYHLLVSFRAGEKPAGRHPAGD